MCEWSLFTPCSSVFGPKTTQNTTFSPLHQLVNHTTILFSHAWSACKAAGNALQFILNWVGASVAFGTIWYNSKRHKPNEKRIMRNNLLILLLFRRAFAIWMDFSTCNISVSAFTSSYNTICCMSKAASHINQAMRIKPTTCLVVILHPPPPHISYFTSLQAFSIRWALCNYLIYIFWSVPSSVPSSTKRIRVWFERRGFLVSLLPSSHLIPPCIPQASLFFWYQTYCRGIVPRGCTILLISSMFASSCMFPFNLHRDHKERLIEGKIIVKYIIETHQ